MMKRLDMRILGGVLLLAAGVLLLLQNFHVIENLAILWIILFAAAAFLFFYLFLSNREQWWAVIPAFTFLGLTGTVAITELLPEVGDEVSGVFFLCMLSLAFWVIYFLKREQWWVIIPGGVLLTLALIEILSPFLNEDTLGGVLFLGLGATFGVLALLPTPSGRMKWAMIPAAAMLLIGVILTAVSGQVFNYLWPIAMILGGLYLILRMFRKEGRVEE